ncbi:MULTISPECIES: phasin family protein [unclassified Thermosynechococcus]|uniref:phasin family protein n=1 Tax=unclassified Thermosynechococcus TaxID=2622553 RepID=UPI00122E262B|nr:MULTISPECIES: phasin family protein [unclassified Thermosynechococcus]MDR5638211.1 phasin family protein [Thermosynechococcus sp. PP42]MDR7897023.1 phasin family protein [Thermosynechococcus sp. JY1332]MDR7904420.1 phasin family protein [Thermosynechococcus sp. JY1334]MDR7920900.1 phasin family protein [Thermosynechococcus sp. HY213]MDR7992257.1 phasin family protein [Thermosynechococcus sp. TG252]
MNQQNLLQQLLLIGVGTTSLVAEKLRQVSDQWVKEGRLNADQAKAMVDEVLAHLKEDAASLDEAVQRQTRQFLESLGVPQQSEIDELRGRIDRLERDVRELKNRSW